MASPFKPNNDKKITGGTKENEREIRKREIESYFAISLFVFLFLVLFRSLFHCLSAPSFSLLNFLSPKEKLANSEKEGAEKKTMKKKRENQDSFPFCLYLFVSIRFALVSRFDKPQNVNKKIIIKAKRKRILVFLRFLTHTHRP